MTEREAATGKYMYCIIRSNGPKRFATPGIGERRDVVYPVHLDDLAAVVSDSPLLEYESSRRNMMAHTLVLEEVMQEFAILPVRFGTVAPSAEAIQEKVLKRRCGEFHGLLSELHERSEFGLKVFWYEQTIFREIAEESLPVRRLRDALAGRPVEQTYYQRLQLGELVEKAMWRKRDEEAEMILTPLRPHVDRAQYGKVLTDRMVLNAAFLVARGHQHAFDEAIRSLDEQMGHRLIFKVVGPVPPYNFVNITVSWDD